MSIHAIKQVTRRVSRTTLLVALISMIAGTIAWNRDPNPVWVSEPVNGGIHVLGFTSKGEIVTHEETEYSKVDQKLRVRGIDTGAIIREFPIGSRSFDGLTPDGKWLICGVNDENVEEDQFQLVSVETFEPRFPLILGEVAASPICSADSRYMILYREDDTPGGRQTTRIVDLTTGRTLFPVEDDSNEHHGYSWRGWSMWAFSPDSQQWVTLVREGEQYAVVFRDMATGLELGRCPLPQIPHNNILHLGQWTGDRLEVHSETVVSGDKAAYLMFQEDSWTFRIQNMCLTDMRTEPLHSCSDLEGRFYEAGTGWIASIHYEYESLTHYSFRQYWNSMVRRLFPPTWWMADPRGCQVYQFISPVTEETVGRPVVFANDHTAIIRISTDGKWLAETTVENDEHQTLRLWGFPTKTPWRTTLLAAAVPWLLLLFRRSKEKTSE